MTYFGVIALGLCLTIPEEYIKTTIKNSFSFTPKIVSRLMNATENVRTRSIRTTVESEMEQTKLIDHGLCTDGVRYKCIQANPPLKLLQCYNCQKYDHVAKVCKAVVKCMRCGEDHNHKECKNEKKCVNCGEGHAASYKFCPIRRTEILKEKEKQATRKTKATYAEILKGLNKQNTKDEVKHTVKKELSESLKNIQSESIKNQETVKSDLERYKTELRQEYEAKMEEFQKYHLENTKTIIKSLITVIIEVVSDVTADQAGWRKKEKYVNKLKILNKLVAPILSQFIPSIDIDKIELFGESSSDESGDEQHRTEPGYI